MRARLALLLGFALACGESGSPSTVDMFVIQVCESDAACDDGLFCNGSERCDPDDARADRTGCVLAASPCERGQRCDEEADACEEGCAFGGDADGDGRASIACGGDDCDDTDPNRFPGNPEICDPDDIDEDCDPRTFGDRDRDGDGDIDAACCNFDPEGGPSFCGVDCNDDRRDVRPGLLEVCDALDNDCDGTVDEGVVVMGFADDDRDLHGDPSRPIASCAGQPGFSPLSDDCDDTDPARHGAQVEVCDAVDNDCDGLTDESPVATTWYRDADDDGFGSAESGVLVACVPPPGHVLRLGDCDDTNRSISPLAPERCNGLDDDCSGRADFMLPDGDQEDDDGDGVPDAACGGADCDDGSADVGPGAIELEDGRDNDCDGIVDEAPETVPWFADADGDGYGDDDVPTVEAAERPAGRVLRGGDCDDGDAAVNPEAADGCNGRDQDCDGDVDEDAPLIAYYPDGDGDGWGTGVDFVLACRPPPDTADRPLDCDDANPERFPSAPERCNGEDTDCDGSVDETVLTPFLPDADGDGFGNDLLPLFSCTAPASYVLTGGDCDDLRAEAFPMAPEDCNAFDDDCDGAVDEAGVMCPPITGGMGVCTVGECIAACDPDRGDCNGLFSDGCETDTETDPAHCGGCFMACSPGDTCGVSGTGCDEAGFSQLVSGFRHVSARRVGGGTAVWGSGGLSGSHGGASTANLTRPSPGVRDDLVHVDAGWFGGLGVTTAGRVFAWGLNTSGQVEPTLTTSVRGGVFVRGLSNAQHASMGAAHSCAVIRETVGATTEDRVYCWGEDFSGELGPNGTASMARQGPHLVPGIADAREVWAGSEVTCVLRVDPTLGTRVECWGNGLIGQLGNGADLSSRTPVAVTGLPPDVTSFAQGASSRPCVLTASGRAYCWGGPLPGDGSNQSNVPVIVGGFTDVVAITSGPTDRMGLSNPGVSCVVRSIGGGEVWCWGDGSLGGLGVSGGTLALSPVRIEVLPGIPYSGVRTVAGGAAYACISHLAGASDVVSCWGANDRGQLGRGTTSTQEDPGRVLGLP
ncbi:MAG: MopE-related protein [Myxococcota bacterium]